VPAIPAAADDLRLLDRERAGEPVAQDVTIRDPTSGDESARPMSSARRLTGPAVTLELRRAGAARSSRSCAPRRLHRKPRSGTVGASSPDRISSDEPTHGDVGGTTAINNPRPQPQIVMPNVVVDDDAEPNGIVPRKCRQCPNSSWQPRCSRACSQARRCRR
jgi:hypothetical protein